MWDIDRNRPGFVCKVLKKTGKAWKCVQTVEKNSKWHVWYLQFFKIA